MTETQRPRTDEKEKERECVKRTHVYSRARTLRLVGSRRMTRRKKAAYRVANKPRSNARDVSPRYGFTCWRLLSPSLTGIALSSFHVSRHSCTVAPRFPRFLLRDAHRHERASREHASARSVPHAIVSVASRCVAWFGASSLSLSLSLCFFITGVAPSLHAVDRRVNHRSSLKRRRCRALARVRPSERAKIRFNYLLMSRHERVRVRSPGIAVNTLRSHFEMLRYRCGRIYMRGPCGDTPRYALPLNRVPSDRLSVNYFNTRDPR